MTDIDAVLFDLGGVLIDFGGVDAMGELAAIDDEDEVWRRWLTCRWVRAFERGGCSPEEFAAGMVEDWGLQVEPHAYLTAFASWPGDALPGAEALVADVRRSEVVTGCLSNTNPLHWEQQVSRWPFVADLDHRFLSFELGFVKPDRELFDEVAARLDLPAERILFFDDNAINVEGAQAAGFQAYLTKAVAEARACLVDLGVLR